MEYSSNDLIDAVQDDDPMVEVVGFVIDVKAPLAMKKFRLFKFTLSNGSGREIQCNVWGDAIDQVVDEVVVNKIIHINGAKSKYQKNKEFNKGNVSFELNINNASVMTFHGLNTNAISVREYIPIQDWDSLSQFEGQYVQLDGYLKMKPIYRGESRSSGMAVISNGISKKMEIKLVNLTNDSIESFSIEKASAITVRGMMDSDERFFNIRVDGIENISARDCESISMRDLISTNEIPRKRARMN